jgi:hypothetical protein
VAAALAAGAVAALGQLAWVAQGLQVSYLLGCGLALMAGVGTLARRPLGAGGWRRWHRCWY